MRELLLRLAERASESGAASGVQLLLSLCGKFCFRIANSKTLGASTRTPLAFAQVVWLVLVVKAIRKCEKRFVFCEEVRWNSSVWVANLSTAFEYLAGTASSEWDGPRSVLDLQTPRLIKNVLQGDFIKINRLVIAAV